MSRRKQTTDRGQTGIGATYAAAMMILLVTAVLTFGYVYVSTPAISAGDTTTEASVIGDDLTNNILAVDEQATASGGGPQLDPDEVDSLFIDGETDQIEDHRINQQNDLNWNITLVNRDASGDSSVFDGEHEISVGEESHLGASKYTTPATLDGKMVIVEVRTW